MWKWITICLLLAACHVDPLKEQPASGRADEENHDRDWPHELTAAEGIYAWSSFRAVRPCRVTADDVELDFGEDSFGFTRLMLRKYFSLGARVRSAQLDDGAEPSSFTQVALEIRNRRNVTIRNLKLSGFKVGILVENCENVRVENCSFEDMYRQRLYSDGDREDGRDWLWPHNNDNGEWAKNYGAAIYLKNCRDCRVIECRGRDGQNGIVLDRCEKCRVRQNDFSYHSGWGCALWRSSSNLVVLNDFNYCVRGYSHGVYARGQDSAGILMFEQCHSNEILFNSATHGGDGFFLYAGHETTQRTGEGGCNGNIVYANDFSYAVANGIEATFSQGNIFAQNRMIGCDYGVWAGYSYRTLIADNLITDSLTAGVAIEHGHDNRVIHNVFRRNRRAVWLWWDEDPELLNSAYGRKQNTDSADNAIERNTLEAEQVGVALSRTTGTAIRANEFRDCFAAVDIRGACAGSEISGCNLVNSALGPVDPAAGFSVGVNPAAEGDWLALDLESLGYADPDGPVYRVTGREDPIAWKCKMPELRRGRESIFVDEWGPVNLLEPGRSLVVRGPGRNTWYVRGWPGNPFTAKVLSGDVAVESFDTEPRGFRVRPMGKGVNRFEVEVSVAGMFAPDTRTQVVRGVAAALEWRVSFWRWQPAEGHDGPGDWAALVAGEPLKTLEAAELNYMLQGGAPEEGVPTEFFATVATTTLELQPGTYRLLVTSDDGVRIYIDEQLAHENWGIHGPITDTVPVPAGKHTIRIEHFQRQGWAALKAEFEGW